MPNPNQAPAPIDPDEIARQADAAWEVQPDGSVPVNGTEVTPPADGTIEPGATTGGAPAEATPAPEPDNEPADGAAPETTATHTERHSRVRRVARHIGRATNAAIGVTFKDTPENSERRHARRVAKREQKESAKQDNSDKAKAQKNLSSKPKTRSATEMHDITGHTPVKPKAPRPASSGKFKNRLRSADDVKDLLEPPAAPDPNQQTATPNAPAPPAPEKIIIPKSVEEIQAQIEASKYEKQLQLRAEKLLQNPQVSGRAWLESMKPGKYALWSERDIVIDQLRAQDTAAANEAAVKKAAAVEAARQLELRNQQLIGQRLMQDAARDIKGWADLTPPEQAREFAKYADRRQRRARLDQELSLKVGRMVFGSALGEQVLSDVIRAEADRKRSADKDDDQRKGGKPRATAGRH